MKDILKKILTAIGDIDWWPVLVILACLLTYFNITSAAASDLDAEYRYRYEKMEREIERDTARIDEAQREQERRNATPYYPTPQYGCGPKCDDRYYGWDRRSDRRYKY